MPRDISKEDCDWSTMKQIFLIELVNLIQSQFQTKGKLTLIGYQVSSNHYIFQISFWKLLSKVHPV